MSDPVLVEPVGKEFYRILSGFHRYEAAFSLGWVKIPMRVLKSEQSPWIACKHIFWIRAYRGDPHPVEWAGIIRVAEHLNLPPRSALQELLTPIDYPLSDHLFSLLLQLSRFPRELLKLLLDYPLSFRQVERLILLSKDILPKLATWGAVLRMRTQELLEIGEMLDSFCRQFSDEDQEKWFRNVEMRILDQDLPRDERLYYVKTQFDHVLRPTLQKYRQRKNHIHRQLDIPKGMIVSWDEDLEKEDVAISLAVKNAGDLDRFQQALANPAFKKNIAKLLKSYE
ncbi:hypothetical protein AMJ86_05615 [bacterium SM23_57]|nr:MAG: hypothetical protein AMJ86_05615 [bacterium SM23_57]